MHEDQVDLPIQVVSGLVGQQFPQWRELPLQPVTSHGTVNALFRLGEELVLRFPLQLGSADRVRRGLIREQESSRRAAQVTQFAVPEPVALGEAGDGYDGTWAVYRWIPGQTASVETIADLSQFAEDLAGFVLDLKKIDTQGRGWDGRSRGGPLDVNDDWVRLCLSQSTDLVDTVTLATIWDECLAVPMTGDVQRWIHTDLMPGNLLTQAGRLAAVIDFGGMCIGDPAVDLMPAWNLLDSAARKIYRDALEVDDDAWERGRGWALVQGIGALPYYLQTNPVMSATGRSTLNAILEDWAITH